MDVNRDWNRCPFIFHMVIFYFQPLGFAQLQWHIHSCDAIGQDG